MEAANRLKANLKLKGQPCVACAGELDLGEDVAICNACQGNHHASCWDRGGGCATPNCPNAPLARLTPEPGQQAQQGMPPGTRPCPRCGATVGMEQQVCLACNGICTPDGLYHGPKVNAPGATASLVYGIIGLFFCGVIFGPLAISKSKEARGFLSSSDPRYQGHGMATAGKVLGIIDLILWGIVLMLRIGAMLGGGGR